MALTNTLDRATTGGGEISREFVVESILQEIQKDYPTVLARHRGVERSSLVDQSEVDLEASALESKDFIDRKDQAKADLQTAAKTIDWLQDVAHHVDGSLSGDIGKLVLAENSTKQSLLLLICSNGMPSALADNRREDLAKRFGVTEFAMISTLCSLYTDRMEGRLQERGHFEFDGASYLIQRIF